MLKPIEVGSTQPLSEEFLKSFPKVTQLIIEFGLLPPTEQTYAEVNRIVRQGLPLLKSLYEEATIELLKRGRLNTEKVRSGEGFDVIYASILKNKGYGPLTLVLSPNILAEGRFVAYCIDCASSYLTHQVNDHLSMDMPHSDEEIDEIRQQLMGKYTLNREEFYVFYSYCVASLCEYEEEYYSSHAYEEKLRFITFDIGLPEIQLSDLLVVMYKQGWGDVAVDTDQLRDLCRKAHIAFVTIENRAAEMSTSFSLEKAISALMMDKYNIPNKYRGMMSDVA